MTPIKAQGNAIAKRFFLVIETLQNQGIGIQTMCKKMHIDRRNLYQKRKIQDLTIAISPIWLAQMCKSYDVSADWLLTGRGEMFK